MHVRDKNGFSATDATLPKKALLVIPSFSAVMIALNLLIRSRLH